MKRGTSPVFLLALGLSFMVFAILASPKAQNADNFPESSLASLPDTAAVSRANKAIAEDLSNRSVSTEVVSNITALGQDFLPKLDVRSARARIWDVHLVYYTAAFAERQGLPRNQILNLPEGVEVISYTQTSVGKSLDCNLNVLLRSDLGMAVPPTEYRAYAANTILRFPRTLQKPDTHETPNSVNQDIPTARDYGIGRMTSRSAATTSVNYYKHDYYDGYDYFSFNVGCSPYHQNLLEAGNAALWLKKKDGPDYTQIMKLDPDDFIKIPLPVELTSIMLPLMKDGYAFVRDGFPKTEFQKK